MPVSRDDKLADGAGRGVEGQSGVEGGGGGGSGGGAADGASWTPSFFLLVCFKRETVQDGARRKQQPVLLGFTL